MYRHTSCTENCSKLDRFIVINIRNKSTIWLMGFFSAHLNQRLKQEFLIEICPLSVLQVVVIVLKNFKVDSTCSCTVESPRLSCFCYAMYKIQQMKLPLKDHQQYISYQIYKNLKEISYIIGP